MPLHEYEENKRRKNIDALMASGACHICGSTARNTKGFSHCLDHEDSSSSNTPSNYAQKQQHHYNDMGTSLIPAPQTASMRSCACFGQSKSDPDYWPYSLRCCEMCIANDCKTCTGRIRSCGICGTVACDENCGIELVECTDDPEHSNKGCLECREEGRLECFAEMDIFKTQTLAPDGTNVPRMTRVCIKCIEKCTPWVKYEFTCRLFKCNTRLVSSNLMELKRFRTFGSSPLNLLPVDGLAEVVDYLSNIDLKELFFTNSAMCSIAERIARKRVEACHHFFPPGPLKVGKRKNPHGKIDIPWVRLEGTNDVHIRVPEDGKFWVGILHHMEQIASNAFYFSFQTQHDEDAVCRFMQNPDDKKFQFFQAVYINETQSADVRSIPRLAQLTSSVDGILIRSSHVLITDNTVKVPFTAASSEDLVDGTHRFICRLFCPGTGSKSPSNFRSCIGSFGILSKHQTEGGALNITWAQKFSLFEGCQQEDSIFGFEYNTETRRITVYFLKINKLITSDYSVADTVEGDLVFAIGLTPKTVKVKGTLLTVRKCDESEWEKFRNGYEQCDDEFDKAFFDDDDDDDENIDYTTSTSTSPSSSRGGRKYIWMA